MCPVHSHSGFAALIGRPNVGKSTLFNRMIGQKVAIVSPKPQTTRSRIMGVVTLPEGQVALFDTPGIHQAKGALNRYMVEVALSAAQEGDLSLFLIESKPGPTPEVGAANRLILERLKRTGKPTVLVINKTDQVKKPLLLPLIDLYRKAFPFTEVVPISALTGDGVEALMRVVVSQLPEGGPMFEHDTLTDQSERALAAELIREQVLRHCREEVPHSAGVMVEVFDESERAPRGGKGRSGLAGLIKIDASIVLERESQKAIAIGKGGQMLKAIGTDARRAIERLLGTHVYLSLRVRVEPSWTRRLEGLKKLGYP